MSLGRDTPSLVDNVLSNVDFCDILKLLVLWKPSPRFAGNFFDVFLIESFFRRSSRLERGTPFTVWFNDSGTGTALKTLSLGLLPTLSLLSGSGSASVGVFVQKPADNSDQSYFRVFDWRHSNELPKTRRRMHVSELHHRYKMLDTRHVCRHRTLAVLLMMIIISYYWSYIFSSYVIDTLKMSFIFYYK